MKNITLLGCVLFSLNGIAQSWDFKAAATNDELGWAKGSQTLTADNTNGVGVEVTWEAAKTPRFLTITGGIDVSNDIMAITVINNSTEPIAFRAKFPKSSTTGDKFYRGSSWDVVPAGTSTPSTYYFDLSGESEWTGHGTTLLDTFELQIGDTGASNTAITARDDASSSVSTIIIEKIEFIDAIPTPSGAYTSVTDGDWNNTAIWDVGAVPSITNDVIINHVVTVERNGPGAEAKSLTLGDNPAQLIVRENTKVTVDGDVSLTRTVSAIQIYGQQVSGKLGTFIFGGTYTANKRTHLRKRLSDSKWHLIGNPFLNNRVDHTTENSNTKLQASGGILSLASYDDSVPEYVYYTSVTPLGSGPKFGTAQGYSISVSSPDAKDDFVLDGVMHNGSVSYTLSTAGNGFNLLGNPYVSYLHANDGADATNNILRVNGANGADILAEDTIWLWDGDNEAWITKNLGDASFRIAPVQGFFVKASSASPFNFTKDMESHDETDAFLKISNSRFEIDLSIASNEKSRSTSIRYIDNMTTSFDNGYDSSVFGGYASTFELYTGLVDDPSKKLAIQSLPNTNYDAMVIPVGVTATANSQVTFSVEATNIPLGYNVYLEDRTQGTFTRLDEANTEYIATVASTTTEGRFYLHTSASSTLAVDSEILNSIGIYKTDNSNVRITGLTQGEATVTLYNLLGKEILTKSFTTVNGVKNVSLPSLANGVYIVKLETQHGNVNKKIILN